MPRSPVSNSSTQVWVDGQSLSPIRQSARQVLEPSHAPLIRPLTTPHHAPGSPEHTLPTEAVSAPASATQRPTGWQV